MKKILCFILSVVLVFNNAIFVYADISGTIPTPVPTLMPIPSSKIIEILAKIMHPEFGALEDFFKKDEIKEELDKEGAITSDNDYVYINSTTVNNINNIVQDSVHYLDGYVLYVPEHSLSDFPFEKSYKNYYGMYSDVPNSWLDANFDGYKSKFNPSDTFFTGYILGANPPTLSYDSAYIYNINHPNRYLVKGTFGLESCIDVYETDSNNNLKQIYNKYSMRRPDIRHESSNKDSLYWAYGAISSGYPSGNPLLYLSDKNMCNAYGAPIRVFYSLQDLKNFLNKGRIYAPQLPSTTISIPIKYINNTTNLPDITYNITTENKTEVEIQNQYDTTLKNYLDSLDNFTDGTDPTPTPKPDGGFTDGTTPTPTPAIGDGSDDSGNGKVDLSEITDLLKKILDKLTSFADSHSKFEKVITDYIEANDGKLDQIIEAINVLSDGKTEDEKNGCKYDFTALSDFMTDLWNESDKKFDTMIDLLEENNKYQQKLVNSLNEIKAILVTQTIMDVFQDRSQQTAEKAKDKFPTSLPWDIALVVNAMSAEPEKPQFNLPIQIKSLNINEEIHVDLASSEWEKLAKTCRYLLSILFILLMIQLSRNLFFNGGDD